mmetsp:Transcript_82750/g.267987  ORF Transcript_82750/g.267987 Transcript_82750/m.267987 type:complete len:115 (-) Transcript_82750:375-719(-)
MSSGAPRVDSVSSDCGVLGFLAHQQSTLSEPADDNDDFRKGFFAFAAVEVFSLDLNADHQELDLDTSDMDYVVALPVQDDFVQARDISADALSGESSVEVPSLDTWQEMLPPLC